MTGPCDDRSRGRLATAILAVWGLLPAAALAGPAAPASSWLGFDPIFLDGFESAECALWSSTTSPIAAPDADEDAFGDELLPTVNCVQPSGTVLDATDCDDSDPEIYPGAPEICNNLDDDCDDVIDMFSEPCYTGPPGTLNVGVCVAGLATCTAGQWGTCVGEVTPTPEVCNNLDDDCNGIVDDLVIDTNPACLAHTFLGTVAGDAASPSLPASSFDEQFYRVTVSETNAASTIDLTARVTLDSPVSADFDLYVYCLSCGGTLAGSSNLPTGMIDVVDVGRDDLSGDQSYDLLIEVRFVSASLCGNWQLTVAGNVATPNRACN